MTVRHFAVCLVAAVVLNVSAACADALSNLGVMYYNS
jgi:hypothetical protein